MRYLWKLLKDHYDSLGSLGKRIAFLCKWPASGILILAYAVAALGYVAASFLMLAIGAFLWLITAVIWKEPSLYIMQIILTALALISYVQFI